MSHLFDEIVQASGLSSVFATSTVRRVVTRCGLDPERLEAKDIQRLLPELRKAMRVFLGDKTDTHVAQIQRLVR
jgi:hypothetical protein